MPGSENFLAQQFGHDGVQRGEGVSVRRIEHGDQTIFISLREECLLVLNLTDNHWISGHFDKQFQSGTPLIHSISVLPPEHQFEFKIKGHCRILAVRVPVDVATCKTIKPRFNEADAGLAGLIWRSAVGLGADDRQMRADALMRHLAGRRTGPANRTAIPAARLDRVLQFVEHELADTVSTSDMAAVAGMSKFHFSRAFMLETGTTPHQYLLGRRVARAVTAIGKGLGLDDAAFECGFANASHLALHLRKGTGVTSQTLRDFLAH